MKVPRPTVHLLDLPTPLAFSAGMLTSRTTLYLSEELTRRLSREELRAVVAYELARLKNKDVRATTAGAALASVFVALAFAIDETLFLGFLRRLRLPLAERRRWLPGPMIYLLSPLIIGILRLATNRSAVFTADEDAASAIGDPQTLAQTLWKLDAYLHARPLTTVGPADANLFLVNPICALPSLRLFNVLPSVKQRITRLVGHYPL
jgi:heat shock protein HtpX